MGSHRQPLNIGLKRVAHATAGFILPAEQLSS